MTGSVDERVTTLIGHLMDKFRDVDAAVASVRTLAQPGYDAMSARALHERLLTLEQEQRE